MSEQIKPHSDTPEVGTDFILTSELLDSTIDENLGPTSLKLTHPDYPAVLVRQLHPKRINILMKDNPDRTTIRTQNGFIDELREKYQYHYQVLREHGIEVPDFALVPDENGETRIITHKIIGESLFDAIAKNKPGAMDGLHQSIFNQINYFKDLQRQGEDTEFLADIVGAKQRMFGHKHGETAADDRVILVDINPDDDVDFINVSKLKKLDNYLSYLITMAMDVVEAENSTSIRPNNSARPLIISELIKITQDKTYTESIRNFADDIIKAFKSNDLELLEEYDEY